MSSLLELQRQILVVVILASLVEAAVLAWRARGGYAWREMGVSLADVAGRMLLSAVPLSLAAPVFALAWQHRITTIALDGWVAVLVLFVGQEFCYYLYHRAAHRVRFFWANHAVHHSPNELNLSAAYRLGWMGKIAGAAVFFTPLVWLGFRPQWVIATLTINLLYQFWIHASWIPRLGPLEGILNTPSAHRVHHAANLEYLDANYGGVLVVFDRLFGTYVPERDDLPCRYGLVKPMRSSNPFVVELSPWVALARDLRSARSLREVLGYLVGPPGWRPDGRGETTEDMRRRAGLEQRSVGHGSGIPVPD